MRAIVVPVGSLRLSGKSAAIMAPKKKDQSVGLTCASCVALIRDKYGKASVSLTKAESTEGYALYDVCQDVIIGRLSDFALVYENSPILVQYSQDSTPLR
eukprot:5291337-Amphidinium_carterae.1